MRAAGVAALGAGIGSAAFPLSGKPLSAAELAEKPMQARRLGKIGYEASMFSMGGMSTIMDRENGRVRNIGISSHSSATLMEAMNRYDLDCMFMTLNPADLPMRDPENLREMLAMAEDKDVGVAGMKIVAHRRVFDKDISMKEAMYYALSLPIATAVLGITSIDQIDENVRLVKEFEPYDDETMARLETIAWA